MSETPFIPFKALHAVLMVARHGALGPAAAALGVTPGAVSQLVRRAEARANTLLFDRTGTGLIPSAALEAILSDLEAGFSALARAQGALDGPSRDSVLTITVGNVFASRWLIWRMADFSAHHPGIELRFLTTPALVDLGRPDIDCGIRFGTGAWPGVDAVALGTRVMFPVCAPALAERLQTPEDLTGVPVISDPTGMLDWRTWLDAAGVGPAHCSGPAFTDSALAFDAAIAGQGVLLAVAEMAEHAMAHGQLVRPFPLAVPSPHNYWFVTAKGRALPARTRKFRDWLFARAARADGAD